MLEAICSWQGGVRDENAGIFFNSLPLRNTQEGRGRATALRAMTL